MEEELYQASKEVTEDMPVKKELMLLSLIEGAFNVNGFKALEEFLLDEGEYPPQKCNKPFLNKLDKLAHKEMDKNQFANISLLLKALQRFCKEDSDDGLSFLIKHGLIQKMLLWFERATEFLKTVELKSSEALTTLVEDIFDTVLAICKCSDEGRIQLLDTFVLQLGHGVTDFRLKISIRLEAVRTFNSMLDLISREAKVKFHLSEEMYDLMLDLAKTILEVGDYEIQVAVSEALCRMTDRKTRETLIYKWFDEPNANAFKEIKDSEFETDCRKFLNELNKSLCNKRRVYTYPCNSAFLDLNELKIPADDKLEKFWIDFNLGSRSVTFFIKDDSQDSEIDLWETVSLLQEGVKHFSVEEVNRTTILIINLKGLLSVSRNKGKKVKIYFDSEFDILNTTKLVYGEEKVLNLVWPPVESQLKTTSPVPNKVTVLESQHSTTDKFEISPSASDGELGRKTSSTQPEEQRWYSDTERQHRKSLKITSKVKNSTPLVSSKSTIQNFSAILRSKDVLPVQNKSTENNEGVQCLDPKEGPSFDEAAARVSPLPSDTLSAKKISPPEITELKQKQSVDAEGKEAETSVRRHNMTPASKRTTSKSLKRDVFHFETSSDSTANLLVNEARRKILGKKSPAVDQVRNVNVASKKRSLRGEKVMHKRNDLKKFLTEESSNEGTDHSWLLESQVKVTPKVTDYSRHKKRKKSVLRVLPLSFESSEDEEQKQRERKLTGKTQLQTPIEKQKMPHTYQMFSELQNTPAPSQKAKRIKTDGFSIRKNLGMDISLLTPPDTLQKMTPPSPKFPGRISMKGRVLANEERTSGSTATRQESAKSPSEGSYSDSNYMDEDEATLTPFLHYKPKRLFASAEKYLKAEEPEEAMRVIESSLTELDDGDLSDPNISAAFQNFTEEMRKKLRFCYRKMERYTKQSLQSSEEKISTLLNQIHNYRLQKLNMFEETVAHELKNLEEDTQTLKHLEEETLNFWKQQCLKFSQFYENQEQRMNALTSFPEDKRKISKEIQVNVTENEGELASLES